jgi:hypothetical protein
MQKVDDVNQVTPTSQRVMGRIQNPFHEGCCGLGSISDKKNYVDPRGSGYTGTTNKLFTVPALYIIN